jgi:hypothetical protein
VVAEVSATPLAKKLGIKEGHRVSFLRAPSGLASTLGPLPSDVQVLKTTRSQMDVIVFFVTGARDLDGRFDNLARTLSDAGGLWIAWPKKASSISSELTFETVQERGLEAGLVDNKSCSIDDDWQALRFVYRLKDRARRSK